MIGFFILPNSVFANACTSTATGNFNASGTWTSCGGTTPQATDSITIANTHTVTVTADATVTTATINSDGILALNSGVTLTLSNTGTPLVVNGTFNPGAGTIKYAGATATVTGTTFNNLTLGGTGTYTMPATTININGDLVITNGATVTKGAGTVFFSKGGT